MAAPTRKKPAARPAPRPYHHGDLRRALHDAAREELRAVGWAALSLRSVARRAGVSHTAAYHHYEHKDGLLMEIALEGFDRLDACMRDAMDAAGADPVDRVVAAGVGYLKMAQEDPQAYDLMFNGCHVEPTAEQRTRSRRSFERLLAAVEAARAACDMPAQDALADALVHWELVHGLAMLARTGHVRMQPAPLGEHIRYATERTRAFYARPAGR